MAVSCSESESALDVLTASYYTKGNGRECDGANQQSGGGSSGKRAMEKIQNPGRDMFEKRLSDTVTKALDGHLQSTSSQVGQQKTPTDTAQSSSSRYGE